jgi:hypothetical protein
MSAMKRTVCGAHTIRLDAGWLPAIMLLALAGCGDAPPLAFQPRQIPVGYDAADMLDVDALDHDGDGDADLVCATSADFRYLEFADQRYADATAGTRLGDLEPAELMHPDGDDYILRRGQTLSRLEYSGIGTWEEVAGPVPDESPPAGLVVQADLDGDGHVDRVSLDGTSLHVEVWRAPDRWVDVSAQVGAASLFLPKPGTRVCAADMEGDGDIDLFVVGKRLYVLINNGGPLDGVP